ncbi:Hypothetical_protein [Hexamita inflata]|uniref:Hypothetical_protein n=1 Tax=Hexamita inflata TaxID=28002 RepID=A0AA86P0I0_9EUKA|nr:Hypothetical protein HINF_LOCUS17254 [Hexamita inflata]
MINTTGSTCCFLLLRNQFVSQIVELTRQAFLIIISMFEVFKQPPVFTFIEDFIFLRMNYLGNIKHQERLISRKPINLKHFSGCLQHGKLLSTMFGGTIYCVRADLFIKAKNKKTDSI